MPDWRLFQPYLGSIEREIAWYAFSGPSLWELANAFLREGEAVLLVGEVLLCGCQLVFINRIFVLLVLRQGFLALLYLGAYLCCALPYKSRKINQLNF